METDASHDAPESLLSQLQQQYQAVVGQIAQLRQTTSAQERSRPRNRSCQATQAEVLAHLKQLEVQTQKQLNGFEELWDELNADVHAHPESFQESLQWLLPDLGVRGTSPQETHSEIEVDLLSHLVLACGDAGRHPMQSKPFDSIRTGRNC